MYKTYSRVWTPSEEHTLPSKASAAGKRFADVHWKCNRRSMTDTSKDSQYIYPVNVRHPSSGSRQDPDTENQQLHALPP